MCYIVALEQEPEVLASSDLSHRGRVQESGALYLVVHNCSVGKPQSERNGIL